MLDVLTILEYARKGALADYEKACMMHRLLNVKETQALIDDAWGTAKELTRLMNLKAEQVKKQAAEAQQSAETQQPAEEQRYKQAIKEAPYVLVIKWNDPIMGEMEYPFKSYAEVEKNFEVAKREVHNRHATEAHVYEQGEGQRIPVMGIMSGKL
jgi:hypothetical protein